MCIALLTSMHSSTFVASLMRARFVRLQPVLSLLLPLLLMVLLLLVSLFTFTERHRQNLAREHKPGRENVPESKWEKKVEISRVLPQPCL